MSKVFPNPKTRTDKLVKKHRELTKVDAQHVDALMDRWACRQSSCPNERGFCVIVDGIHLHILAQHLRTWSMAINDDDSDLEMAPAALLKTLIPAKSGTKNPFRETSPTKDPAPSANVPQIPEPHHPPTYFQHPYGYFPYNRYPQLPPPPLYHAYPYGPEKAATHPRSRHTKSQRQSSRT